VGKQGFPIALVVRSAGGGGVGGGGGHLLAVRSKKYLFESIHPQWSGVPLQ